LVTPAISRTRRISPSARRERVRVLHPSSGARSCGTRWKGSRSTGRDLIALAYLAPGAAPAHGFYNPAPRLTINGSSSLVTNYAVDGFDNTDLFLGGPKVPVTIGSTERLSVLVNSYSSEYGRTGNGVFAVTTRSGTNRHTGDLFYVVRPGSVIDSANAFAPRGSSGEVIDDSFRRHQMGGSAGGPLLTGRTFFFGNAEITRESQDAILPSPLAGAGADDVRQQRRNGCGFCVVLWASQCCRSRQLLRYRIASTSARIDRDSCCSRCWPLRRRRWQSSDR
jgi:hypothetical protein